MRMTVERFVVQSTRIRRVIDYIGTHLDEDIRLDRLADMACLSSSQLERLYRSKVGETPITTVRRLRLKRAWQQLDVGAGTIQDIGLAAGYGSGAAFTHAFGRQFGLRPSQAPSGGGSPMIPDLHLEHVAEREVYQKTYHGIGSKGLQEAGLLAGNLAVAGARHWRTWTILDRDHPFNQFGNHAVEISYFVPAAGQPAQVKHLDKVVHSGGLYVVWHTLGIPSQKRFPSVIEQIRQRFNCYWRDDRHLFLREITVSGYTAPQERQYAIYIPVVPCRKTPILINHPCTFRA